MARKRQQGQPEAAASRPRAHRALVALGAAVVVAATVVAYVPCLRGPFIWDDNAYVVENDMVRSEAGLARLWLEPRAYRMQYFPLTYTTLWADYQAFGEDTFGYHLENVLLHAANALLLWALLVRLSVPGGFVASLLFALHPCHVESVAWICERKNTLSLLFMLLAALLWLSWSARGSWRAYGLVVLALVAGLLSKSIAALVPVLVLLLEAWRGPRGVTRRHVLAAIPLLALGALMLAVTAWVESQHMRGPGRDLSAADSAVLVGRALWFYAGKLAWPEGLTSIYPKWTVDPSQAAQWAPPLLWAGLLACAWAARSRVGRGPILALAVFTIAHLPTAGIKDFGYFGHSWVADHFQYVPSLALLALAAAAGARALERLAHPAPRMVGAAAAIVATAALGWLTWTQAGTYASLETFWRTSHERNPTHTAAGALGDVYLRQGDLDRALPLLEESLRIVENERGWFRLGELHAQRGEVDEAIAAFEKALEVSARRNRDPLLESRAWFNLGALRWRQADRAAAADAWSRALELDPGNATTADWLARAIR
jgi:hypothetical protein